MMKGFTIQQQQQQQVVEDNMSNLTSASADHQQPSVSSNPLKKKRNLPGNPDPDAEVIAFSPKSLMATNRFLCEICNKGFQRDQNLQLHRRGHNLPWKLKQRENKELIRKKVYICPEVSCVHHDPSRALGDLTGIKKHFSRKHGEKKWKCEECSKKYAVQSDWKAHSKICGTREYRCDCGTLFSRRDSFITHRAFCDALAEASAARVITCNPPLMLNNCFSQNPFLDTVSHQFLLQDLKKEKHQEQQETFTPSPWMDFPPNMYSTTRLFEQQQEKDQNPSQCSSTLLPPLPPVNYQTSSSSSSSAPLSATALLQKAAQMGSTMSRAANQGQMAASSSSSLIHHEMMMGSGFDQGLSRNNNNSSNGGVNVNEGMTRDFLGLRALSHRDLLNMAGLEHCMRSSSYDNNTTTRSHGVD